MLNASPPSSQARVQEVLGLRAVSAASGICATAAIRQSLSDVYGNLSLSTNADIYANIQAYAARYKDRLLRFSAMGSA